MLSSFETVAETWYANFHINILNNIMDNILWEVTAAYCCQIMMNLVVFEIRNLKGLTSLSLVHLS